MNTKHPLTCNIVLFFWMASFLVSCDYQNKVEVSIGKEGKALKIFIPDNYDTNFQWVKYSDYDCQNFHVTSFTDTNFQSYAPDTVFFFQEIDSSEFYARKNISIYEEINSDCKKMTIEELKNYLSMVYVNVEFMWSKHDDSFFATGYYNYERKKHLLNRRVTYIIQNDEVFFIQIEESDIDSTLFISETNKIIESIEVLKKNHPAPRPLKCSAGSLCPNT